MKHEEARIQEAVVYHVRRKYPNLLLTTSPASMKLTTPQAVRMKRMGYLAGTPDILIFEARKGYYGLFIELKALKGVLSEMQRVFKELANAKGYKCVTCYGAEEAIVTIEDYLK